MHAFGLRLPLGSAKHPICLPLPWVFLFRGRQGTRGPRAAAAGPVCHPDTKQPAGSRTAADFGSDTHMNAKFERLIGAIGQLTERLTGLRIFHYVVDAV